jgi:hypothetical protein
MSAMQVVITIVIIVAVVAVALVVWLSMRRRQLRDRFGPEYDRVVSEQDSQLGAVRELRERERRHEELELRPLSDEARERYSTAWQDIQARFLDAPNDAVREAHDLVTRLISERGYPTSGFEEQLSYLSVEHARTLGHYRDAHEISERNDRGEATTEELRQALVHYRSLFADLLGENPVNLGAQAPSDAQTDAGQR